MPNLESSQAQPVKEIKEDCQQCQAIGYVYFKNVWDAITYLEAKDFLIDEPLRALRQYEAEGGINCGYCNGKGYRITKQ